MKAYLNLMKDILENGELKEDRTKVGTLNVFGRQMRFDLSEGFPLLTTKKLHLKSIIVELLWFLKGDTNVQFLKENGCNIWNEWCDENGDLGPIYGKQWRSWESTDGHVIDRSFVLLTVATRKLYLRLRIFWQAFEGCPDPFCLRILKLLP